MPVIVLSIVAACVLCEGRFSYARLPARHESRSPPDGWSAQSLVIFDQGSSDTVTNGAGLACTPPPLTVARTSN